MGCPSEVTLGENVVFSITTHDADTGRLADAASPAAYRVYDEDDESAIDTGTMPLFDSSNTTGFYLKKIECSTGNGFAVGKTYTVYIEATVDGDTGGVCYAFRVSSPHTLTTETTVITS